MYIDNDDIVIHPVKTKKDPDLPGFGIIFVNPGEAKAARNLMLDRGGTRCFLHNSQLVISANNDRFVAGPAVGAPVATLVLEKLIALGAERLIFMGWCGAIDSSYQIGDVIIPDGAVCGEGTSQYYCKGAEPGPSEKINQYLQTILSPLNFSPKRGRIWSTDAPYRESRSYLKKLNREKQVVGVDMEFSALCNVARFRGIDFGAVMLVSDEIGGENWKPGFNNSVFKKRIELIVELLLNSAQ